MFPLLFHKKHGVVHHVQREHHQCDIFKMQVPWIDKFSAGRISYLDEDMV